MAHEGNKIAFSKVAPSKSNLRLDYTLPERHLSVYTRGMQRFHLLAGSAVTHW